MSSLSTSVRTTAALLLGLLALAPPPVAAQTSRLPREVAASGQDGNGCEEGKFVGGKFFSATEGRMVFDDTRFSGLAMRLATPVFENDADEAPASRSLRFGEQVRIADPGEGKPRLRVNDSRGQSLGWVARASLLCRQAPISDPETGLFKRVVVRTETAVQGTVRPKSVFETPDTAAGIVRCTSTCLEVSRFQWYFIYAEANDHYLISGDPNLGSNRGAVIGWLPKADGYIWNTALGLRPREELADAAGGVDEKFACSYRSMEDLTRKANCAPVLGGKRWYGLDVRMNVLGETPQAYEVLFSNAASVGQDNISSLTAGLNRLDVFFVIDGTKSMGPAIENVRELVTKRITRYLQDKLAKGGTLRLGFRIYRDSNAKANTDGVTNSEFLALPKDRCAESNIAEFTHAFEAVRALDIEDDDDFPENTFGGLAQASEDASGCKDNAKIIFVIGDAGYDVARQKARGVERTTWTETQIADRWRKGRGTRFATEPQIVFIETPRETGVLRQAQYNAAYRLFEDQARSLLRAIYKDTARVASVPSFFIRQESGTSRDAAISDTLSRIDATLNPDVMKEIATGVNAGESLQAVIDRLRNNSGLNIPVYQLQYFEDALCGRLGEQCRNKVLEQVTRAFVPVNDDVVPEVLLSSDQLDKWLRILNIFKNFSGTTRGTQGRDQLVNTLMTDVGNVLQVDIQSDNISLRTRAQFVSGLPNSSRSRLMQYSDEDLRDKNRTPDCEIDFLKQYASKRFDTINIIKAQDGRLKPIFRETTWPDGACPNLSIKGKNVPFIDSAVTSENLNETTRETSFSMMHLRSNEKFFWIPVSFLP